VIDGTFVKEIAERTATPQQEAFPGGEVVLMAPTGWSLNREPVDRPAPLELSTLTGVADLLRLNVDALDLAELMIHVTDPNALMVVGKLKGKDGRYARHNLATAHAWPNGFKFDTFMSPEAFIIGVNACFVSDTERDELLATVASIRETNAAEMNDDGVSQEIKTARNVAFASRTKVGTVVLRPWRTFREVTQPASEFFVRLRPSEDGELPKIALFEADGGQWKNDAMLAVADWLRNNTTVAVVA